VRVVSPTVFAIATASAWALTVVAAALLRNRLFATFAGVILGVQGLISVGLFETFEAAWPAYCYLQACTYLHFLSLSRARMRPLWWRTIVSIPALWFAAGTFLAMPVSVVAAFGVDPAVWVVAIPFAVAGFGLLQSLKAPIEDVHLVLDGEPVDGPRRHAHGAPDGDTAPLRIVQITDPHLGPLMSVSRLRGICERAVAAEPDLIAVTGDFLTMESQSNPRVLHDALAPLAAYEGKVFACFGNHDHEAPQIVKDACAAHGIRLLIDDEATLETSAGPVQILGADFAFRDRRARLEALCERFARRPGHLRLLLLHDPGAFRHVPEGEADLVLSGHTHGGQVGLLSVGLKWTFVSGLTSIPDHGFWARGRDRLYVHRGTGVYGFPLRVGVPGEESTLHVHDARPEPA